MSMETSLYKAHYVFSKKAPKFVKEIMIKEYMKLRHTACDELNPHFDEWNSKYTGREPSEDVYSEQSKEYNDYIRVCEESILTQINKRHRTLLTEIHADEIGDLIAINKIARNLTMHLEFECITNKD